MSGITNQNPDTYIQPITEDNPPSYEQITIPPDGPPPSYESIFGRVKNARENSSGIYDFFKKVFVIIITTIECAITLGFSLLLPASFLVVGSIYVNDCPAEYMIPVFLIVLGIKGIISVLLSLYLRQRLKNEDPTTPDSDDAQHVKARINGIEKLLQCFIFVWVIAGSVWVYRTKPSYTYSAEFPELYCHKVVYLFTFWVITLTYVVGAIFLLCACCFLCSYILAEEPKE